MQGNRNTSLFFFIKLKKAYETFKFLPCAQGVTYNLIICPLLLKVLKHLLLPSIKDPSVVNLKKKRDFQKQSSKIKNKKNIEIEQKKLNSTECSNISSFFSKNALCEVGREEPTKVFNVFFFFFNLEKYFVHCFLSILLLKI